LRHEHRSTTSIEVAKGGGGVGDGR
jgi:hypothetical protein